MSRDEAVLRYKTAMSIFKKWFAAGTISETDLLTIGAMLAEKYGLSSRSIFLEKDLLCKGNRGIVGTAKGDLYGQEGNEA